MSLPLSNTEPATDGMPSVSPVWETKVSSQERKQSWPRKFHWHRSILCGEKEIIANDDWNYCCYYYPSSMLTFYFLGPKIRLCVLIQLWLETFFYFLFRIYWFPTAVVTEQAKPKTQLFHTVHSIVSPSDTDWGRNVGFWLPMSMCFLFLSHAPS